MKTCVYCQHATEDYVNFCPVCGQPMPPSPYTQTPPVAKPKQPAKVKSIVGLALSINGLVGAVSCLAALAYVWFIFKWGEIVLRLDGYYDPDLLSMWDILPMYCLLLGIVGTAETLPCAIIGRIFGKKALDAGNTSKIAKVAFKLGLFGIIASILLFVSGILCTTTLR